VKPLAGAVVLALCTLTAATTGAADDGLAAISRMLDRSPVICAEFTQSKTLRVLKRPLVSSGRLVFLADKGILWQVREPFPTRLLVKQDALIRWNESGEPERIGFAQSPVFGAFARVFISMFTGAFTPLQENFTIASHLTEKNWRLDLTPRDQDAGENILAKIFARIRVMGSRFVDELEIEERRGDRTRITFTNMGTTTCRLDTAEKGYFDQ